MLGLETDVKVVEKTITLKELLSFGFNKLQKDSHKTRTRNQFKKDVKFISEVISRVNLCVDDVVIYKNKLDEYIIVNKENEIYSLDSFVNGDYGSIYLSDNNYYYYHTLDDTSMIDNLTINVTIVSGDPMNSFGEIKYSISTDKTKEELLQLVFMSPWVEDMKKYFTGRSNPGRNVFSSYTDKKIPNLNLMNAFTTYRADSLNFLEEEYVQSVYNKKNAKEEWDFYLKNINGLILFHGWED